MPVRHTHYEILGVPRTAPPDEIKRRYRTLAKRCHPDVAKADPGAAHAAFVRLSEAYSVLSDPQKRESYDRELKLAEAQRLAATAAGPNVQPAAPTGATPRPAGAAPRRGAPRPRPDVSAPLRRARRAFQCCRLWQARALCEEILHLDLRNAEAYALLGDIYRAQGRGEEAIRAYSAAVQLDPRSALNMAKLERMMEREWSEAPEAGTPWSSRLAAALGWVAVGLFVALPRVCPGSALGLPPVAAWTDSLLIGMALAALLAGFVSTLTGFLAPLGDEFLSGPRRAGGRLLPVGLLVGVVSLLFFPLAPVALGVLAVGAEIHSRPLARTMAIAAVGAAAFALAVPAAAGQTLLLGGNLLFPCLVVGSVAGGHFRKW